MGMPSQQITIVKDGMPDFHVRCGGGGGGGGHSLNFYLLVTQLHHEARTVDVQARLISQKRLKRYQRKVYKLYQGRLFRQWKRCGRQEITVQQLLSKLAKVVRPPSDQ